MRGHEQVTASLAALGAVLAVPGAALASTVPVLDLGDRGAQITAALGLQPAVAADVALGPVVLGLAGMGTGGFAGGDHAAFGALRAGLRGPALFGGLRLGLLLSGGLAQRGVLATANGTAGVSWVSQGWLNPAVAWAWPLQLGEARPVFRGTAGVVVGGDGRVWTFPASLDGTAAGLPLALNAEVALPVGERFEVALALPAMSLGARARF